MGTKIQWFGKRVTRVSLSPLPLPPRILIMGSINRRQNRSELESNPHPRVRCSEVCNCAKSLAVRLRSRLPHMGVVTSTDDVNNLVSIYLGTV